MIKDERCPGCGYRKYTTVPKGGLVSFCAYCLETGDPRGCSAEQCFNEKIHYKSTKLEVTKRSC